MLAKFILWVTALIFISYGLACLFWPELPAGYAGLDMLNGDAQVEIGAMYGGLQTAFGIACLLGAVRNDLQRHMLLMVALVVGGLAIGRIYGAFLVAGVGPLGVYTWGAMAFEVTTTLLACIAYRGSADK